MSNNYIVIGNDHFIREKEVAKIRDKFLSESEAELNFSVYSVDDINGIMDSLGTMPFLADNRVVLIKDAQNMPVDLGDTLANYLEQPSEANVLIISAEQAFKKNKNYKKLKGLTEISAGKPDANTVKGWIRGFFKKEGVEITPGAVDLIVELKGDDTIGIRAELEKLLSFSGGTRIEEDHVEELVGRSVRETIFKLVDAITARNADWAWQVMDDLYDQKKRPQEIIGYLGTYIRKIQKIKILSSRGADQRLIASEIGTASSYYAKRMIGETRRFSVEKIDAWTTALLDADSSIKGGKLNDHLAVEMLLSGLMK